MTTTIKPLQTISLIKWGQDEEEIREYLWLYMEHTYVYDDLIKIQVDKTIEFDLIESQITQLLHWAITQGKPIQFIFL